MDGVVDERSIAEVQPADVAGYERVHFFAGISGWDYALQLAGWPDDRPVWTGSCPCQPFSSAGKGLGAKDERHLWPEFARLIRACNPPTVFGEQVASKAGREWLAGVFADLEGMGYQRAGADLCAAGVGAPHIRQRLFWVADASTSRLTGAGQRASTDAERSDSLPQRGLSQLESSGCGTACGVGDSDDARLEGRQRVLERAGERSARKDSMAGGLADSSSIRLIGRERSCAVADPSSGTSREVWTERIWTEPVSSCGELGSLADVHGKHERPRPTDGFWRDADWLACRDGKWRAVEPGAFPLAHGVPGRVGLLRGYGNAIVPQVAAAFIEAYLEAEFDLGMQHE